jgi:phosphoglycerol transferase
MNDARTLPDRRVCSAGHAQPIGGRATAHATSPVGALVESLCAVLLSIVITALVLHLWHIRMDVPLAPDGDAVSHAMLVKTIMETGWFSSNPRLGAPAGAVFLDWPFSDAASFLLIKLLALFTDSYGVVMNLFYLASFPLTSLVSLHVLRRWGLDRHAATAAALLYTFIPYHFMRGEAHLLLSSYYAIPLAAMIAVELAAKPGPYTTAADAQRSDARAGRGSWWLWVLACVVVGSSGAYYASFAMFLFGVAGCMAAVSSRRWQPFMRSVRWAAVVFATVLANILPSFLYWHDWGRNIAVAKSLAGVEMYGLKITHLLLPVPGHRIDALAKLTGRYLAQTPLNTENYTAALGLVGSAGFLACLFFVVLAPGRGRWSLPSSVDVAARLVVACVLLATIGGFSSLIGIFLVPDIRAYNRISVVIAFLSLFVFFWMLQTACADVRANANRWVYRVVTVAIVGLGVLDQTSPTFVPDYDGGKRMFATRSRFVSAIEKSLPPGAMVYQLPYLPYPGTRRVDRMGDYDLFRGYLHSASLRWSYGAMKGRPGDDWDEALARQPLAEQMNTVVLAGFTGLYVDRFAYADDAAELGGELSRLLALAPLTSDDARLAFYDLRPYAQRLRAAIGDAQWRKRADAALFPLRVAVTWSKGYSAAESDGQLTWHWSDRTGVMFITNSTPEMRRVRLHMRVQPGHAGEHAFRVSGDLITRTFDADERGAILDEVLVVAPGYHVVSIETDAPPLVAPGDPRWLYFRVTDFSLEPVARE